MENESEKLDHQVAGLPSLCLASSRIQFSVRTGSFQRVTQVKPPFSVPSMRTLLVMIGAWFMLNAFLVVAAINDKLQSWVRYLLCTSVVIGLVISGAILMLP